MNIKNNIKMAFKSLSLNKARTFLTMLGVIIGVFAVALLTTVTDRATDEVIGQLQKESQMVTLLFTSNNVNLTEKQFKENIIDELPEEIGEYEYATVIKNSVNVSTNQNGEKKQLIVAPISNEDMAKDPEFYAGYIPTYKNDVAITTNINAVNPNYFSVRNLTINGESLVAGDSYACVVSRDFVDTFLGSDVSDEAALGQKANFGGTYSAIEIKLTNIKADDREKVYTRLKNNLKQFYSEEYFKAFSENLFVEKEGSEGYYNLTIYLPQFNFIDTTMLTTTLLPSYLNLSEYDFDVEVDNASTNKSIRIIVNDVNAELEDGLKTVISTLSAGTLTFSDSNYDTARRSLSLDYGFSQPFEAVFGSTEDNIKNAFSVAFSTATKISDYSASQPELINKNGAGSLEYTIKGVIKEESSLVNTSIDSEYASTPLLKEMMDRSGKGTVYVLIDDATAPYIISNINGARNPIAGAHFKFVDEQEVKAGSNYIMTTMLTSRYSLSDFVVISMSSVADIVNEGMSILTILLTVIAAISLVVGGVGIMNIMIVVVSERTREIGIRKAIGAKRSSILFQFLSEAIIITVCGGIVGVALAQIAAFVVGHFMNVAMWIPLWVLAMSLGFCIVIGIIFGMYPAIKASKLHPIEALRRE